MSPSSSVRFVSVMTSAVLVMAGCAQAPTDEGRLAVPTGEQARDDLIDGAQLALVTRCMSARGLALPGTPTPATPVTGKTAADHDRRVRAALFGTGRRELSVTLSTGYTVTANTDGCLAAAHRDLYGDQHAWFRAQTIVNNLRAEARARMRQDPRYRAAMDRWTRCATPPRGRRPAHPDPDLAERCAQQSGLAAVQARLETAQLNHVRALHHDQLTLYRELRTRAARRAAEFLNSTGNNTGIAGGDPPAAQRTSAPSAAP